MLLNRLALDPEPAVAAVAFARLLETDPPAAARLADRLVASRDATLRHLAARSLEAVPSEPAVALLGPMLDDPHPEVRAYVRDALFRLAGRPELDGPVRDAGVRVLSADGWRGLEQSALLLGTLDHEPAADRLVGLLEHSRPEVTVAAAWAVRRIAVPAALSPALEVARRRKDRLLAGTAGPGHDEQIAQLFQMFAAMDFAPADPLLREYVPKRPNLGDRSRSAAVWALGHLHAGKPDEALVEALQDRLRDAASMPPETASVRRMAAVSLGRMEAREALPALRAYNAPEGAMEPVGGACNWAINRLTGEIFPVASPSRHGGAGWFLEPL
jgi:HEAT repeat protein